MKRLTYIVVILALIYSGYWFVGARAVESGATDQLTQMSANGWDVGYESLETRGFPSRFDTTVKDFSVGSPDGAWRYAAPQVQALALSYDPTNIILAFPQVQTVKIADQTIEVLSERFRASVDFAANTSLALMSATAELDLIALQVTPETRVTADGLLAAIRQNTAFQYSYDTYFTLPNIALPREILAQIDPSGQLPHLIQDVTLDATVRLDRPLDRHTLTRWQSDPGKLRGLDVRSLLVQWGDFTVSGDGSLTVDTTGLPEGKITLRLNDWQAILDTAIATGAVPAQFQFIAQSMGQTLSQGQTNLDLPIIVQNGNLSVGQFPLGPAPRFY